MAAIPAPAELRKLSHGLSGDREVASARDKLVRMMVAAAEQGNHSVTLRNIYSDAIFESAIEQIATAGYTVKYYAHGPFRDWIIHWL